MFLLLYVLLFGDLSLYFVYKAESLCVCAGVDTDELDSHIENFEEETIEFLIKVEETIEE